MDTKLREDIRKLYCDQYPDYFGAKAGANSLAGVVYGKITWLPSNGCHGAIRGLIGNSTLKAIYSSLWCRYEDLYEAAEDYWSYLLGPKGPWSKYMTDIDIIKDDKGRSKAFGTWNTSQRNNAWVPCMMQCRVPQESSNKLRSYWYWRRSGMDQPTSLYLSEHLALHISGYFSQVTTDYVHAFNWEKPGIDIERIRNCDPIIVNHGLMNKSLTYGPVNYCWTTSGSLKNDYGHMEIRSSKNPPPFNFKLLKGDVTYKGFMPHQFKAANDNSLVFKGIGFVEPKEASRILKEASSWH